MSHILILGPLLSTRPGWVTNQGETLAARLSADGYRVLTSSSRLHPPARALDHVVTLLRHRRRVSRVVVLVFSGRAFLTADLCSGLASRLGHRPVLWLHGGALPAFARRHPRWVGRVLARGAPIVAPSAYLAEELATSVAAAVIPNVVDVAPERFHPRARPAPTVLWMRTFHTLNRPELALHCLLELRRRLPAARLTMAGQDRGLKAPTRELAAVLGLADCVDFPGFLDSDAKAAAFAAHDLFLSTNSIDNAPVSLLEAAAHGLPIVASRVGGLPYLFAHRESALLAAPDSPTDHAAALAELVASPELASRLSHAAHRVAQQSSWEQVRPLWERLLPPATQRVS